jgi:hypothetical protein
MKDALHERTAASWAETSGLLTFLSRVRGEVTRFDEALGYGIRNIAAPPTEIDGKTDALRDVGFVVVRHNTLLPERTYCLYSLLRERRLSAFIGTISGGSIHTVRALRPLEDFSRGTAVLYEWLRDLVKASCEKI